MLTPSPTNAIREYKGEHDPAWGELTGDLTEGNEDNEGLQVSVSPYTKGAQLSLQSGLVKSSFLRMPSKAPSEAGLTLN